MLLCLFSDHCQLWLCEWVVSGHLQRSVEALGRHGCCSSPRPSPPLVSLAPHLQHNLESLNRKTYTSFQNYLYLNWCSFGVKCSASSVLETLVDRQTHTCTHNKWKWRWVGLYVSGHAGGCDCRWVGLWVVGKMSGYKGAWATRHRIRHKL